MNLYTTVYKKLLEVPEGKITTYGDLARAVGLKNGQRVVGQIMARNKFPVLIPCHRVVRSDGQLGGYAYGQKVKANMLSREGVDTSNGKVRSFEARLHRF